VQLFSGDPGDGFAGLDDGDVDRAAEAGDSAALIGDAGGETLNGDGNLDEADGEVDGILEGHGVVVDGVLEAEKLGGAGVGILVGGLDKGKVYCSGVEAVDDSGHDVDLTDPPGTGLVSGARRGGWGGVCGDGEGEEGAGG
jgi:hypothetical protein